MPGPNRGRVYYTDEIAHLNNYVLQPHQGKWFVAILLVNSSFGYAWTHNCLSCSTNWYGTRLVETASAITLGTCDFLQRIGVRLRHRPVKCCNSIGTAIRDRRHLTQQIMLQYRTGRRLSFDDTQTGYDRTERGAARQNSAELGELAIVTVLCGLTRWHKGLRVRCTLQTSSQTCSML